MSQGRTTSLPFEPEPDPKHPGDQTYEGGAALLQIVATSLPTLGLLAVLLAAAGVWQHLRPVGFPDRHTGLERALIQTQVERGYTIPRDVDVLLLGDSSGLMGIDPQLLGERLGGLRVESLCTMGFVGPRGYAALWRRYLTERGHAALVLIVLHPLVLEWKDIWQQFESMAIGGIPPPPGPPGIGAGIQARLLAAAEPFLYVPLAGVMGDYYGSPPRLADYMQSHQGSAIEPGRPLPATAPEKGTPVWGLFGASEGFLDRLAALTELVDGADRAAVRLVLMPMAATYSTPRFERRSRAHVVPLLHERLHLDQEAQLVLPDMLPGRMFGSPSHLNPAGRTYFTRLLAAAIARDRARTTGK